MSDHKAEDGFGFASEQAPHPQALAGARHASTRFRGRWRSVATRDDETPSPLSHFDDVHGDDPSIWVRASENAHHFAGVDRARGADRSGFLTRAARVAFRKLMGS